MLPRAYERVKITYGRSTIYALADYPLVDRVDESDLLGRLSDSLSLQTGVQGFFLGEGPYMELRWDSRRGPLGWTWEIDNA